MEKESNNAINQINNYTIEQKDEETEKKECKRID